MTMPALLRAPACFGKLKRKKKKKKQKKHRKQIVHLVKTLHSLTEKQEDENGTV